MKILLTTIAFSVLITFTSFSQNFNSKIAAIKISSKAFDNGGMIPKKFSCDGKNISPALTWKDVPISTRSLALIVDDPDAPMGTWVHWLVYNIPPAIKFFPENMPATEVLPNKAFQGSSSNNRTGYHGPCPPGGTHRYFFKIYALDTMLDEKPGITKEQLLKAMEGHIIGKGELMGKFKH